MNIVQKVVGAKCPICEKEKVFQTSGNIFLLKAPKMRESCANCGHKYETEPGFFFGSMFVSYGLIVGELGAVYLLVHSFVSNLEALIAIMFSVIVVTSFTNFKYSRLVWMYLLTPTRPKSPPPSKP
jgi:uncharacterized protein (DUF983 family)